MLNQVILSGRLTATPELKTSQSGLSISAFTIAVDRPYQKDKTNKVTDFIGCVAWRNSAEFVTKYFHKGDGIEVVGSLQVTNYTDKNGNKRTRTDVNVSSIHFPVATKTTSTNNEGSTNNTSVAPTTFESGDFTEVKCSEDDLPF